MPAQPERYQHPPAPAAELEKVPAHHRPPNVIYDDYGRPHHVVLAQPSPPPVIVQMPAQQQGLDPALQRLIIITFLIVLVMATVTGCVCAVVVLMGGTLIGIIGAVGQNLTALAAVLVGLVVAIGWAANKVNNKVGKTTNKKGN